LRQTNTRHDLNFDDKLIFLTGGSTGIGLDYAKAYAAEGASVVLCARDEKDADIVAKGRKRYAKHHYPKSA